MNASRLRQAIIRAAFPLMLAGGVLTAASIWALATRGLHADYRLEAFVASSDPAYERLRAFMAEFTSNEFTLVAIHSSQPFDANTEAVLQDAVARLRKIPTVERASALTDIPAFVRATAGERLYAHPLLAGNLISRDRKTVAILCQMSAEDAGGAQRRAAVARLKIVTDDLRQIYPEREFILTGPYVTLIDMYAYVDRDLKVFALLALGLMLVTLGAVFRRVGPMLYAGAVGAAAILVTLGATIALGIVSSLITQMLVILIIVLAVANCVHLAVAARESRLALPEAAPASRFERTLGHMLAPCCAVMLTTAAGFGSVCISEIAPVRRFGALMVLGLAIALVLALAGVGPLHRGAHPGARHDRLADGLGWIAGWAERHRRIWALGFALVVAGAAWGIPRLRFESDFVKNFRPQSEVRRGYRFIEKNLTPLGSVEIVIRRADGGAIATLDAARKTDTLGRAVVAEHEAVRHALTLWDLLTLAVPTAPVADADVQARLGLLRMWPGGAGLRRNFLNDAGDALRINLRCLEGYDVNEKLRICAAIERQAGAVFGAGYTVEVTGLYYFYARLVAGLLRDQYRALGITILAITLVIGLMLRSARWTLVAMIINLLPVVVCLGVMGWLRIPVNMTTAMMLSATLGIAVDDTLHYIWRYRREAAGAVGASLALNRTHRSVGQACVFTTVVIAGGFSILTCSAFLPTAYFGGLVGFTMFVALAADLVLLPVLIRTFIKAEPPA
jgi:predicted RND superfamily exporter protein